MQKIMWNEIDTPTVVDADEFKTLTQKRKLVFDNREVVRKAINMAMENPGEIIKCAKFSATDLEEVKVEERKWKQNLRTHIKKESLPIQLYTQQKGNTFFGYVQYIPNREKLRKAILDTVDTVEEE